jgi:hypothetical protein
MSDMLVAPSTIEVAKQIRTVPRSPPRTLPTRQSLVQRPGQPGPVRTPPQQDRTRMTDQTLATRGDLQPLIPPATLTHRKGAPDSAVDLM